MKHLLDLGIRRYNVEAQYFKTPPNHLCLSIEYKRKGRRSNITRLGSPSLPKDLYNLEFQVGSEKFVYLIKCTHMFKYLVLMVSFDRTSGIPSIVEVSFCLVQAFLYFYLHSHFIKFLLVEVRIENRNVS